MVLLFTPDQAGIFARIHTGAIVDCVYLCIWSKAVRVISACKISLGPGGQVKLKQIKKPGEINPSGPASAALSQTALNPKPDYIFPAPAPFCTMPGTLAAASNV
jgi:hypothetical protein